MAEYTQKVEKYGGSENLKDDRPLLSIAIFGPSGSGKSSLLRTLVGQLRSREGMDFGTSDKDTNSSGKVTSLHVMEPSIWSKKDHFLYSFLASALEEDRLLLRRKEDDGTLPPQGLSPVQIAFQNVNEYLRVIDEGSTGGEYDPLGTSLQRLERHTSGLRLREELATFIEHLAMEISEKNSVVLLPVDDIDMAPDHMVEALQGYQSYLLHPQLVPVFTFTDRMPEELLRVHFERQLKVPEGATSSRSTSLEQMNKRLDISEELAVQFLSRCFPVRNRIRLGPAPGRVQRADLKSKTQASDSGSELQLKDEMEVTALLVTASFLLFGHPDRESPHPVKSALRPSTLRRQIQALDAVSDLKIDSFVMRQFMNLALIPPDVKPRKEYPEDKLPLVKVSKIEASHTANGEEEGKKEEEPYSKLDKILRKNLGPDYSWARIFRVASWSLLNVHRDTLREMNLHLEDLYSWSPRELRSVILDTVLQQNRATRRVILDRWFNRADFRRSQVLSLLAANAFRPWMTGDEPHGDEMAPLRFQREIEENRAEISERYSFSAAKGLLWFIDVTIGFYLPQVLARNWADATSREMKVKEKLSGNGWDLHLGPVNAAKVADYKRTLLTWGMVFLSPQGYCKALDPEEKDADYTKVADGLDVSWEPKEKRTGSLLLRIWTLYGYSRGRFWAAISLWRGLGLMGQILELGANGAHQSESEEEIKAKLAGLVKTHCLASMVPGSLLARGADESRLGVMFPRWEQQDFAAERNEKGKVIGSDKEIDKLAGELFEWLQTCIGLDLHLMPAPGTRISWGECFLRHIHGEGILGDLWPRMNAEYLHHDDRLVRKATGPKNSDGEKKRNLYAHLADLRSRESSAEGDESKGHLPWNAAIAMEAWVGTLLEYWRGCQPIVRALLSCPLLMVSEEMSQALSEGGWESPGEESSGEASRRVDSNDESKKNKKKKRRKEWIDKRVGLDTWDARPNTRAHGIGASFAVRRATITEFFVDTEAHKVDLLDPIKIKMEESTSP